MGRNIDGLFKNGNCGYLDYFRQLLLDIRDVMFKWNSLPDNINEEWIEHNLCISGFGVGLQYKGDLYFLQGAISGIDYMNRPKVFTSANHALPTLTRNVGKNCVVCYNVSDYLLPHGDIDMIDIYAKRLTNIALSIDCSLYNSRVTAIYDVENDEQARQVAITHKQIIEGAPYVINFGTRNMFTDRQVIYPIKARDNLVTDVLHDTYNNIMAEFLGTFGINSLNVDKTQYVNNTDSMSAEQKNEICSNIRLDARKRFCKEFNKMFGTNISVELNIERVKEVVENGKNLLQSDRPGI